MFLFTEINSLVFCIPAKYNLPDFGWLVGTVHLAGLSQTGLAAPVGVGKSGSGV